MNPDDTEPARLTLDEACRLAGFLAERGHTDLAGEILTSATYDTAMQVLAEVNV